MEQLQNITQLTFYYHFKFDMKADLWLWFSVENMMMAFCFSLESEKQLHRQHLSAGKNSFLPHLARWQLPRQFLKNSWQSLALAATILQQQQKINWRFKLTSLLMAESESVGNLQTSSFSSLMAASICIISVWKLRARGICGFSCTSPHWLVNIAIVSQPIESSYTSQALTSCYYHYRLIFFTR